MSMEKFIEGIRHEAAELNREKRHVMYIRDRLPRAYATMLDLSVETLGHRVQRLDAIANAMDRYDAHAEKLALQKTVNKNVKKLAQDLLAAQEKHNVDTRGEGNRSAGEAGQGATVRHPEGEAGGRAAPDADHQALHVDPAPGGDHGAQHAPAGGSAPDVVGSSADLEPGFASRLPDGDAQ